MITITFFAKEIEQDVKVNLESVTGFRIEGHAGYARHGKDIVCAGISALTIALTEAVNCILKPSDADEIMFSFADGEFYLNIEGVKSSDVYKTVRSVFLMFQLGLSKIAGSYPENIILNVFDRPFGDDYNGTSEQTMIKDRKEERK